MSERFVHVKRVVIPMLTALVLVAQMDVASAAGMEPTDLATLANSGQVVEVVAASGFNQETPDAISMAAPQVAPKVVATLTTKPTPTQASEAKARGEQLDLSTVDVSQFKDWDPNQWWATSGGMKYAVGMGYLVGRGTPGSLEVAAGANVTQAEFITVLTRMCLPSETIQAYAQATLDEYKADMRAEAQQTAPTATLTDQELEARYAQDPDLTWFERQGIRKAADELGLTGAGISSRPTETDCTRAQMARLLANTMKIRGEDTSKINKTRAVNKLTDHHLFDRQGAPYLSYGNDIGIVVGAGLIKGDEHSSFNPGKTMTRGEMAEVVYRLDNPRTANNSTPRDEVLSSTGLGNGQGNIPEVPPSIVEHAPTEEAITIDMRTPTTPHRAPKEGDTVIRPDGTQVVLARDPATGVLGFGQNVGPYLGTDCSKGKGTVGGVVEVNAWVMAAQHNGIWTDPLAAGWYRGCDVPGYEYTYLWTGEWDAIQEATSPNRKGIQGTAGQRDETGLWHYSENLEQWIWDGPGQESPYQ